MFHNEVFKFSLRILWRIFVSSLKVIRIITQNDINCLGSLRYTKIQQTFKFVPNVPWRRIESLLFCTIQQPIRRLIKHIYSVQEKSDRIQKQNLKFNKLIKCCRQININLFQTHAKHACQDSTDIILKSLNLY